eukprot:PhF_6_TR42395/c0_g1_i2/m.63953
MFRSVAQLRRFPNTFIKTASSPYACVFTLSKCLYCTTPTVTTTATLPPSSNLGNDGSAATELLETQIKLLESRRQYIMNRNKKLEKDIRQLDRSTHRIVQVKKRMERKARAAENIALKKQKKLEQQYCKKPWLKTHGTLPPRAVEVYMSEKFESAKRKNRSTLNTLAKLRAEYKALEPWAQKKYIDQAEHNRAIRRQYQSRVTARKLPMFAFFVQENYKIAFEQVKTTWNGGTMPTEQPDIVPYVMRLLSTWYKELKEGPKTKFIAFRRKYLEWKRRASREFERNSSCVGGVADKIGVGQKKTKTEQQHAAIKTETESETVK